MQETTPYLHKVQYYETDMMGVTHHANYLRWMEEARIDYMDQLGFSYRKMEESGVFSPVTKASCTYRQSSTFGDTIAIQVCVGAFSGAVLTMRYEMKNEAGELVCEGTTEHVFLNAAKHVVRLKREMPEFYDTILNAMKNE